MMRAPSRYSLSMVAALGLAAVAGCGEKEAASPAGPAVAAASAPAAPAPPRCEVDPSAIPPLPAFEGGSVDAPRLRVEPVEAAAVGRCVPADDLLSAPRADEPTVGAVRGEGASRSFALHRARDVAMLGDGPFLLTAGDAGLFLHDVATLARRARLHDEPASAVAASPDGATAAVLLERPRVANGQATSHELLVFDVSTLEIRAELDPAPGGRLRFSPDGKRVLLASSERALWLYDLETAKLTRSPADDPIADAAFVPDRGDMVAFVGDRNEVQFRDLATGRAIAQSGGAALRTSRDLNAVAFVPGAGLVVAGGDDDRVHVYRGMLGERAEQVGAIELDGNVEDFACGSGAHFVAATSRGSIVWFEGAERVRSIGPLVPDLLGDPIRLALRGDEVFAVFLGQLFRWPGGDSVVAAPYASGELVATDASETDVLVVLRVGPNLVVHRVTGESRPEATTEEVGRLPWADATRILKAPGGARAVLGLDRDGVQVAFVDPSEGLTSAVGPGMELASRFEVAPVGPGTYALWDAEGMVYELDVPAKTWRLVGKVEAPAPGMRIARHPRRGYEALFEGRGRRRRAAVASVAPEPPPAAAPAPAAAASP